MLASTGPLPSGPGWSYEFKWDGIRAIAVISAGTTRLYARSGVEVTAAYPELAAIGEGLDDTVLDGEVVTMDEAGRPSFQLLAERMHVREPVRAARLAATVPVSYLAFDVLRSAGREALATPYTSRRRLLEGLALGPRAVIPSSNDGGMTARGPSGSPSRRRRRLVYDVATSSLPADRSTSKAR